MAGSPVQRSTTKQSVPIHHKVQEQYRAHTSMKRGVHRVGSKKGVPSVPPHREQWLLGVVAGPGAPTVEGPRGSEEPEEVAERTHADVPGLSCLAPVGPLEGYSSQGRLLGKRVISGYRSVEAASNH